MDAVAPLVASLSPAHPRRYDRVRQEQHAHGDEDPPLYRAAPGSDLDMLAKGAERLRREAGERLQRPK